MEIKEKCILHIHVIRNPSYMQKDIKANLSIKKDPRA